jgi:hypothetical protein
MAWGLSLLSLESSIVKLQKIITADNVVRQSEQFQRILEPWEPREYTIRYRN